MNLFSLVLLFILFIVVIMLLYFLWSGASKVFKMLNIEVDKNIKDLRCDLDSIKKDFNLHKDSHK